MDENIQRKYNSHNKDIWATTGEQTFNWTASRERVSIRRSLHKLASNFQNIHNGWNKAVLAAVS